VGARGDDYAVVRTIVTNMRLLDRGDQLKPLDSLTMIELVAELEDATELDLLAIPFAITTFDSVGSIVALLEQARTP
jgi:acyl carrier protein